VACHPSIMSSIFLDTIPQSETVIAADCKDYHPKSAAATTVSSAITGTRGSSGLQLWSSSQLPTTAAASNIVRTVALQFGVCPAFKRTAKEFCTLCVWIRGTYQSKGATSRASRRTPSVVSFLVCWSHASVYSGCVLLQFPSQKRWWIVKEVAVADCQSNCVLSTQFEADQVKGHFELVHGTSWNGEYVPYCELRSVKEASSSAINVYFGAE
jgi:hypothetical protein